MAATPKFGETSPAAQQKENPGSPRIVPGNRDFNITAKLLLAQHV